MKASTNRHAPEMGQGGNGANAEPATAGAPRTSLASEFMGVLKHSVVIGIGMMLGKMIGFLMIPIYTHYLVPAEYGIAQLLDLTSSLLGMMLNLAITAPILRFYFDAPDERSRRAVISTALIATWALNIVCVPLFILSAPTWSSLLFGTDEHAILFTLSFFNLFCGAGVQVPVALLRAQQRSVLFAGVTLAGVIGTLGLNILFIVYLGWGVFGLVLSSLLTQAALALVLGIRTIKHVGVRFSDAMFRKMLAYGFPYAPESLGLFSLHFADLYFMKHYTTLTDVGIYGLAYKFGFIAYTIVQSPYWIVWGAKRFEVANHPDARKIYARNLTYITCAYLFVGLAVAVFIDDALHVMTAPAYWPAGRIVPLIVLAYLFTLGYYVLQIGICLERKTQYLAYAVVAAASLNLVLNVVLIPRYFAMGAALATCLSFAALAAMAYAMSQRFYPVVYEFRRLGVLAALAVVLYAMSVAVGGAHGVVGVILKAGLVAGFPAALYLVGFFDAVERRQIARIVGAASARLRRTGAAA